MSKNEWIRLLDLETKQNATFAFLWSTARFADSIVNAQRDAMNAASPEFQKACKARSKTRKANANRRMRDDAMRSCGLTKVYGSVSGKVYWE